jgi:ketose-bisphosphate aldolase
MKTLKEIFIEYRSTGRALPAFNIDSFEIYQAVEAAIKDTGFPCIVQLSSGEDKFIEAEKLFLLVKKAQIDGLPIYLNMDHGKDISRLSHLAKLGFDMLHLDNSHLDYQNNLTSTKKFIEEVKSVNPNILIEAEFNKISLVGANVSPESFTDPKKALEFISTTHADLLAVSIGNLHGVNVNLPETIDLPLLHQIFEVIPQDSFITLHGGSGIKTDQLTQAIKTGVVKININTDLRLKFKESLNNQISKLNSEKVYEYLTPVIKDLTKLIIEKLTVFSSQSYV